MNRCNVGSELSSSDSIVRPSATPKLSPGGTGIYFARQAVKRSEPTTSIAPAIYVPTLFLSVRTRSRDTNRPNPPLCSSGYARELGLNQPPGRRSDGSTWRCLAREVWLLINPFLGACGRDIGASAKMADGEPDASLTAVV